MQNLPPGIIYLIQRAPKLLLPPALTYGLLAFAPDHLDVNLSRGWTIVSMIMSLPVSMTISVLYDEIYVRWQAYKAGAVLPPRIGDVTPGSVWSLFKGIRDFKDGYIGQHYISVDVDYELNDVIFRNSRRRLRGTLSKKSWRIYLQSPFIVSKQGRLKNHHTTLTSC